MATLLIYLTCRAAGCGAAAGLVPSGAPVG